MCGIVGIWERGGETVDIAQLLRMRDQMLHRGPDGSGWWARPRGDVALGHRRLTIVDLSDAGLQPMGNEDGSVQIVFNGEIYNHRELREPLEAAGHTFRSQCDTEVLVHLYEEKGPDMVHDLVGMFAFAIWDEPRQRLFMARDRLGIKPLYWTDDGETFGFASEIKALLPLLRRREIDEVALAHYLTFVAVPPPRTLFEGVNKLAPGSTLVVERGGPGRARTYWDPIADRASFDGGPVDWAEELRERLERSIDRRMMSDVPVGIFLSGGVDSSTNVALMSRLVDHPVNTFSIGFRQQPEINEFEYARQIAQQFGTNHHEVVIDVEDTSNFLNDLVFHQDEPIADPVCIPVYFVAKLAKDNGVTVAHVGEGADEILAGYPTYLTAHRMTTGPWRNYQRLPGPARRAVAAAGGAALRLRPGLEIQREALRRGVADDSVLWWGGAVAFYEEAWRRVTTDNFRRRIAGEEPRDVVSQIEADGRRAGARDALDSIIYQDLRLRLPELLLMRVDKLTMATSVEARVPFLDHELVELCMAMPLEEKIADGQGKHVLKRLVSDILPPEIVWRPKQGFSTPVSSWFQNSLGTRLADRLERSSISELGFLDHGALQSILQLHRSGRADRSFQLWNVLNLMTWFDYWIAGEDPG